MPPRDMGMNRKNILDLSKLCGSEWSQSATRFEKPFYNSGYSWAGFLTLLILLSAVPALVYYKVI